MNNCSNTFREYLLSETNIDFLTQLFFNKFNVSTKSLANIKLIITNFFNTQLNKMHTYPTKQQEIIELIEVLNKMMYNHFYNLLCSKMPPDCVFRSDNHTNKLEQSEYQQQPPQQPIESINEIESTKHVESIQPIEFAKQKELIPPVTTVSQISPSISDFTIESGLTIISQAEKDELIKKYYDKNTSDRSKFDMQHMFQIFYYIKKRQAHDKLIQSQKYNTIYDNIEIIDQSQLAKIYDDKNHIVHNTTIIDSTKYNDIEISDPNTNLVNKSKTNNNTTNKNPTNIVSANTNVVKQTDDDKISKSVDTLVTDIITTDTNNVKQTDIDKISQSVDSVENFDNYIKGLDYPNLLKLSAQLIKQRTDIIKAKLDASEINYKIDMIKNTVIENREKFHEIDKTCKTVLSQPVTAENNIVVHKDGASSELNLEIDPIANHNFLKNIIITDTNTEKLTKKISLVGYQVYTNINNITRFNNVFMICCQEQMYRCELIPGLYEINDILSGIKSHINFIDFVVDNDKIKIFTTNEMNFELMLFDNTIFNLLGFKSNGVAYRDENQYISSDPYNITNTSDIYLALSGSTYDPIKLVGNVATVLDKPLTLRKSPTGFDPNPIHIKLFDTNGDWYDLINIFKIHLRIQYLN